MKIEATYRLTFDAGPLPQMCKCDDYEHCDCSDFDPEVRDWYGLDDWGYQSDDPEDLSAWAWGLESALLHLKADIETGTVWTPPAPPPPERMHGPKTRAQDMIYKVESRWLYRLIDDGYVFTPWDPSAGYEILAKSVVAPVSAATDDIRGVYGPPVGYPIPDYIRGEILDRYANPTKYVVASPAVCFGLVAPACECGAAKTGITAFKAGHSSWCPVAEGGQ